MPRAVRKRVLYQFTDPFIIQIQTLHTRSGLLRQGRETPRCHAAMSECIRTQVDIILDTEIEAPAPRDTDTME